MGFDATVEPRPWPEGDLMYERFRSSACPDGGRRATRTDMPAERRTRWPNSRVLGWIEEWEISDFDARDEFAFIQIEPGLAEPQTRAVRREPPDRLTARRWRPYAVNMVCTGAGAIMTMLALGVPGSVHGRTGGTLDGRVPAAERLAVAVAESSTLSSTHEVGTSHADPVQRAVWNVLFGPDVVIDALQAATTIAASPHDGPQPDVDEADN